MNRPAAGPDPGPDARLRVMRMVWAGFLITVGLFVLVTRFARPGAEARAETAVGNATVLYVLAGLALSSVAASFALKSVFYKRAAEQQKPDVLQTGFILALALCESAVLFGLAGLFITWDDYAYGLFALGALGEALHFPRREQVTPAYFKPGM
ncbi:MAG TPA: hypothetical protein VF586_11895 [Pyrinomonadaceae bacterium]|jgi:F0F1-type ATP synthase membrane subunit c/vacuolar-type H+-ATPase subunit K